MSRRTILASLALALAASARGARKTAPAPVQEPSALVGVGLVVKIAHRYPEIAALIPDSPAAKDGRLKTGDRIEGIAQGDLPWEDTAGMKLADVARRIRGPRGSKVSLRVIRLNEDGTRQQMAVTLKRGALKDEPVKR